MAALSTSPTPEQVQAEMSALLNGPAGFPPAGVVPNFVNPQNLDALIIIVMAICLTITALAVSIRSYTKWFLLRSVASEDYLIVIAWVGLIGFSICSVQDLKSGLGVHRWDLHLKDLVQLLYSSNNAWIVYGITVCLIKESILLQYRIFVPNRKGNMVLYVVIQVHIWSIFLFYLINTILMVVLCIPRERIWNPLVSGRCLDFETVDNASGIFNILSDFLILILPIIPVWKLQMPRKKKIAITGVFATGIGACVTSILRTYYTFGAVHAADTSYTLTVMGLWTWAELTAGILISCMPVMPRFFQSTGARVRQAFSSISTSKSHSKLLQNSKSSSGKNATGGECVSDGKNPMVKVVPLKGPFDQYGISGASSSSSGQSETWSGEYGERALNSGGYIIVDEFGGAATISDVEKGQGCYVGRDKARYVGY